MAVRLIVTGFEPFGGAEVNASREAVLRLEGVERVILPVSFDRAAERVRALAAQGPDGIVCVGEAGGRAAISVERVAINCMDARIPDNDGRQPVDEPISPGGPAAYFATLPTRELVRSVRAAGIPAELSYTAGAYVCNSTFYALMDAIARGDRPIPGGFIHVPARGMAIDTVAQGLAVAIEALRRHILTNPN